jgi:hypothetical protein
VHSPQTGSANLDADFVVFGNQTPDTKLSQIVRLTNNQEGTHINTYGQTSVPWIYTTGYGVSQSQYLLGERKLIRSSIQNHQ